jgi:hypothetical protein
MNKRRLVIGAIVATILLGLVPGFSQAAEGETANPIEKARRKVVEFFTGEKYEDRYARLKKEEEEAKQKEQIRLQYQGKSLVDNLIPFSTDQKKVGQVEVIYNKYPLSNYWIDLYLEDKSFWEIEEAASNTGHYFLHQLNNMVWLGNVELSRFVVWVLENALELDFVRELGKSVGEGIQRLSGFDGSTLSERGMYGMFLPLMIVFVGGWLFWKGIMEGDDEGAARGLFHAFLVIMLSLTFFYNASNIMTKANDISKEISVNLMAVTTNVIQPSEGVLSAEEATAQAGNNLWNLMVMKPYLLLQYGTTEVDPERVNELLSKAPEKRTAIVQKEVKSKETGGYDNINMTTKNSSIRFGFIIATGVLNLLLAIVMLAISGGVIAFQLLFLVFLLMAPLALVWAVVPAWKDSAGKWLSDTVGALMMKVALGMYMAVYFSFSGALYDYAEDKGYLMIMLLQFVLVAVMFWKRKDIFTLVTWPLQKLGDVAPGRMSGKSSILEQLLLQKGIMEMIGGKKNRKKQNHELKPNHQSSTGSMSDDDGTNIPIYSLETEPSSSPELSQDNFHKVPDTSDRPQMADLDIPAQTTSASDEHQEHTQAEQMITPVETQQMSDMDEDDERPTYTLEPENNTVIPKNRTVAPEYDLEFDDEVAVTADELQSNKPYFDLELEPVKKGGDK